MKIDNLVRENIKKLKAYTSARDLYKEGIFLDANENPFGIGVETDLDLNRYPDPEQSLLRAKLANVLDVSKDNLFFGVGSDEIIDLLIRIFCNPDEDNIVITEPSYGMYEVCANINNIELRYSTLKSNFELDIECILSKSDNNTKIVFLCSPNNPTGNLLNKKDILTLCNKLDSIIVVDEAYIDFAGENYSLKNEITSIENLVILRTFSKAWGLAGARCGFTIANNEVINHLFKVKAPYTINKLTEKVILEALDNARKKEDYVKRIVEERERLRSELDSLSFIKKVYPSVANYFLIKVDNPKKLQKVLANKGVIIRDRSNLILLDGCLRITVGTKEENNFLLAKINEVINEVNID